MHKLRALLRKAHPRCLKRQNNPEVLCKHHLSRLPPLGNWGSILAACMEELRDWLGSTEKETKVERKRGQEEEEEEDGSGERETEDKAEEEEEEGRGESLPPRPLPAEPEVKHKPNSQRSERSVGAQGTPSGRSHSAKHQTRRCPPHRSPTPHESTEAGDEPLN